MLGEMVVDTPSNISIDTTDVAEGVICAGETSILGVGSNPFDMPCKCDDAGGSVSVGERKVEKGAVKSSESVVKLRNASDG